MADPRRTIKPGWYWYDFGPAEIEAYDTFQRNNREGFRPRVTWGAASADEWAVVIFEVPSGHTLDWTLSGLPHVAPKKADTRAEDIAQAPDPPPGLVVMVERMTGKAWDALKQAGAIDAVKEGVSNLSGAVKLLVWGSAAALVWNVYTATRGSGSSKAAKR